MAVYYTLVMERVILYIYIYNELLCIILGINSLELQYIQKRRNSLLSLIMYMQISNE